MMMDDDERREGLAIEWQRTFDAVSDLVFIQDKNNTITKANKAFLKALKLDESDVIGKKCYKLLHNKDAIRRIV